MTGRESAYEASGEGIVVYPPDDDYSTVRAAIHTGEHWDHHMGWEPGPVETLASYDSVRAALRLGEQWLEVLPKDGPPFVVSAKWIVSVNGWLPNKPGDPRDIPF